VHITVSRGKLQITDSNEILLIFLRSKSDGRAEHCKLIGVISKRSRNVKMLYVGKAVCRENGVMTFKYITDVSQLTKGFFSAPEPREDCEEFKGSRHAVCVIPAIAFDRQGYRLGYGKGYYDRYLTDPSIVKVGFAYDELFVDRLPRGRFDLASDLVITPKGVFNTGEK
jgi:5-formyltetrahydrofolate cyclo-ligase